MVRPPSEHIGHREGEKSPSLNLSIIAKFIYHKPQLCKNTLFEYEGRGEYEEGRG